MDAQDGATSTSCRVLMSVPIFLIKTAICSKGKKKSFIHLLSLSLAFLIFALIISENFLKNFLVTLILMHVKTGSKLKLGCSPARPHN